MRTSTTRRTARSWQGFQAGGFVGGPVTVAGTLRALAEAAGVDELMITTDAHDVEVKRRSYRLIAEALAR